MIKSLVKDLTNQNVPEVRGPITIVQGSLCYIVYCFFFFYVSIVNFRVGFYSCSYVILVMDLGKHKRFQFVECPNDINAMVDCAKFADLALLLVDGSYGFEMVRDHFSVAFSFFP